MFRKLKLKNPGHCKIGCSESYAPKQITTAAWS